MSGLNDEMVVPVRVIKHRLLPEMSDRDNYTTCRHQYTHSRTQCNLAFHTSVSIYIRIRVRKRKYNPLRNSAAKRTVY